MEVASGYMTGHMYSDLSEQGPHRVTPPTEKEDTVTKPASVYIRGVGTRACSGKDQEVGVCGDTCQSC